MNTVTHLVGLVVFYAACFGVALLGARIVRWILRRRDARPICLCGHTFAAHERDGAMCCRTLVGSRIRSGVCACMGYIGPMPPAGHRPETWPDWTALYGAARPTGPKAEAKPAEAEKAPKKPPTEPPTEPPARLRDWTATMRAEHNEWAEGHDDTGNDGVRADKEDIPPPIFMPTLPPTTEDLRRPFRFREVM